MESDRPKTNEVAKAMIRAYFAAVNEERWDDVMALYDENARLTVPGVPAKHGKAQIRRFYDDLGRRFERHEAEVDVVLAEGNRAMATISYSSSTRDGRAVEFWASDTFTIEDGLIKDLRIIFDSAWRGTT
jgi:uncharacterized protein